MIMASPFDLKEAIFNSKMALCTQGEVYEI